MEATLPIWLDSAAASHNVSRPTNSRFPLPLMFDSDYVSDDLPGYCASHVLQSPTMWLGVFLGGSVASTIDDLHR